ncbi:MAG: c-type cytochrome [Paracoccaceae bacterium]
MFDTMTLTKAGGALCGSLLVLLLINWGAHGLYDTATPHHHGEVAAQAYAIETGAAEGGGEAVAAEDAMPFAEVYATADAAKGEKAFGKCKACHKVDGGDSTGPHLNGVVGRAVASIAGFAYSDGMKAHGGNWDLEALNAFLTNPKAATPGTKMSFPGFPKVEDRANVIKYLETLGG